MRARYDIVVIGGGMVGATLALSLRSSLPESLAIAVVEAVDLPDSAVAGAKWQPSYDARSSALSAGARTEFDALGLWPAISQGAQPIADIHISDRGHFGMTRLRARDHGVPALGYVVDNSWLGQVLLTAVVAAPGIELLCPARVRAIDAQERHSLLTIESASGCQTVEASLVILADGGRSELSEQLGIDSNTSDYGQQAIVANVTPARHHNGVAYERFTDEGPMALLPRSGGECALIWVMPAPLAAERLELVEDDFLTELQERFGYRVGRFRKVGQRFSYPLALKVAREQVRPGLVVLGNGAHTLHPVAGQGFNLSLRDLQTLVAVLAKAVAEQQHLGSLELLTKYVRLRQRDQHQIVDFSDWLVRLFSNHSMALAAARNLGLVALDLLFPVKECFARQAMGLGLGQTGRGV